jgi:copper chaperone NosL
MNARRPLVFGALLLVAALPRPVVAKCKDEGRPCCDYCRMIITKKSFGGGMVTTKSNVALTFDATECLAAYFLTLHQDTVGVRSMWSIPFDRPSEKVHARRGYYVQTDSLPSPMGLNLSAYISANEARQAALNFHGRVMRWGDVVELVRHHWFANGVPYPKPEAKPDPKPVAH